MEIQPILKSLRRQKTAALLIAFEIALACAIICNTLFVISERMDRMHIDSGVAESELVRIRSSTLDDAAERSVRTAEDLAALQTVAGVVEVAAVQQVPFGNSSWNSGLSVERGAPPVTGATSYFDSGNLVSTLGLRLTAGRDFRPDEYIEFDALFRADVEVVGSAIITQALADKLWPDEPALGKFFYTDQDPIRVIGIVDTLIRPSFRAVADAPMSVIYPVRNTPGLQYLMRVRPPADLDAVLKQAETALREVHSGRLISRAETFESMREHFFRGDRVMAMLLSGVIVALLVVTALGIVGLASFWVQGRRRQIGIRRALGATRGSILRYFQLENFLIVTAGVVTGMFAAYGVNAWLMQHYELSRLPMYYLPIGAIGLWVLGQLSVLSPALRAMRVPPALATKA